ncbi:hypothetical protein DV702_16635 [Sporosarcina sp. PTS2304]|uniref:X2-like carbohydrate binding domain-containing protein n=1 Tax=Sporosarcina sp. PTS2304 TaxID=2283194 RepID=UPI000E0D3763|nr:X2-like carbohydrate binding domain-containing protein [Sporosarcina sp. PTS2304]AXI01204.1 hypothetical protein DV702_16635 [Sporosarcina sp. PTS2304]
MSAQADVTTTVNFGKNANNTTATVSAVKVGGTTLTAGTDYTLGGNTLTIKKEYLASKAVGPVAVAVEFSSGTAATLTVTVSDTTDYTTNSTLGQTTANFDKKASVQADVTTTINFGKNANNTTATVSAVKVGGTTLTAGTDYTLAGTTLTIKKEYLATKAVGPVAVAVEFSSGTAATLTVTVADTTDYTTNSTLSQTTATFDKKASAQADVTTTVNFGKNANNTTATVSAVKVGGTTLTAGTDYTLAGTTLTIKKEYLASKAVGPVAVAVEFSSGTAATLTVTVSDTTDYTTNSTLSQTTATFDKKASAQADITTTVNFGKNANNTMATVSAVKVGGTTLTAGTDYTLAGTTLTIKKEYLASKAVGPVAVAVEFSSGTPAQITITVEDTTVITPQVSIESKTIQSLDFSTTYDSPATLVGKTLTTSQFSQSPKNFTLEVETPEGTKSLPIKLNWNLSTEVPWGDGISGVINSEAQMKFGVYGYPLVSWKNINDEKAFNVVTLATGSAVKISATGPDASYFFTQLSAQGTDEDTSKNRTFTVNDGTTTVTILLEGQFATIDQLIDEINYYLTLENVSVVAEKVNETKFKLTSNSGTLVIGGSHKTDFFE